MWCSSFRRDKSSHARVEALVKMGMAGIGTHIPDLALYGIRNDNFASKVEKDRQ
jgi:hypothetical protein